MGIGIVGIQTSQKIDKTVIPPPPPSGFPFTIGSAHRGTSIETVGGRIVLGQPTGAPGNPANIDIALSIPIDFFGTGVAGITMFDTTIPTLKITFRGGSLGVVGDGVNDPGDALIDLSDVNDLGSRFQIQWVSAGLFSIGGMVGCAFANKFGANLSSMPTAGLHVGSGLPTAGNGQMKLATTVNMLVVPEAGAVEFQSPNLFFTRTATRENFLIGNSGAPAPSTTVGVAIVNFFGSSATNFLGTPNSWTSVIISGTTFKIPLYT